MSKGAFIFDIDGTLTNPSHRLHFVTQKPKNWRAFEAACEQDAPHLDVIEIAQELHHAGYGLIYCSGRTESVRDVTLRWLSVHSVPTGPLYMRRNGDFRKDYIVKRELYETHIQGRVKVLGVFDDRNQVVSIWRELGLRCYQVQPGDF